MYICVCIIYLFVFPQLLNLTIQAMMSKWKRNQAEIHRTNAQRMEWWNRMRIILNHAPTSQTTRIEKTGKPSQDLTNEKFCAATRVPIVSSRSSGISTSMPGCDPLTTRNAETSAERVKACQSRVLAENTESKSKAERNQNRQTLRLIVLPIVLPVQSKKLPRCVWSKL